MTAINMNLIVRRGENVSGHERYNFWIMPAESLLQNSGVMQPMLAIISGVNDAPNQEFVSFNAAKAAYLATFPQAAIDELNTASGTSYTLGVVKEYNDNLIATIIDALAAFTTTAQVRSYIDFDSTVDGRITAQKGAASGLAPLDAGSKIASAYLPSYVDDVIEVANFAALPGTGETGKIYITISDNKEYRWSGSTYVAIVASPGTTDNVPEGTTNLYHTSARVLATVLSGFTAGAGTVASTDTVLQALQKLAGNAGGITKQTGTITRATSDSTGALDVTTSFQPSLVIFSAVDNATAGITSDGWDDGTTVASTYTAVENVLLTLLGALTGVSVTNKSHAKSIFISSGGTGWNANISALASNKFTLSFTKIGAGRNITIKWFAFK